jgi:hypothetical protein
MRILSILIPLALIGGPAMAQPRVGDLIGPDRARAEATLAAQGYKLTDYEAEKGRIEIKAVRKDAKDLKTPARLELIADGRTGAVIRIEREGDHK